MCVCASISTGENSPLNAFSLSLPDPTAWSVANVKSWLEYEAEQQKLPTLNLAYWNYSGSDLVRLTESQFRELIPQGGELLFAKLEYWQVDCPARSVSSNSQQQTTAFQHPQSPLSVNVGQYYNVPPIYQSPSPSPANSAMFSPPSVLLSPVAQQPQLSPVPHMIPPSSPANLKLPQPVIQAERQQQQLKRQSSDLSSGPSAKRHRSPSPSLYSIRSGSFLEESCIDMAGLLQQQQQQPQQTSGGGGGGGDVVPKPQSPSQPTTTTLDPLGEDKDSDGKSF